MKALLSTLLCICATGALLPNATQAQTFFGLGVPDGGSGNGWSATSISNDGSIVTMVSPDRNYEGAYWHNGTVNWMAPRGQSVAFYSQPIVSSDGRYIVYQDNQVYPYSLVRYEVATGNTISTGLDGRGPGVAWFGISGDGSKIVGGVPNGYGRNAAIWTSSGIQVSDYSLSTADAFTSVSANGQNVIGKFYDQTYGYTFIRFKGESADFFSVNSYWDAVRKISNDGSVFLGNTYVGGAFVWSDAIGDIIRPTIPSTFTSAAGLDMTADGRYVVGTMRAVNDYAGMIWDTQTGTVSTLADYLGYAPAGWTITSIDAISANGLYLAGTGIFGGQQLAWSAELSAVPEPSTYAALAGLAALGLVLWRRRNANTNSQNTQS